MRGLVLASASLGLTGIAGAVARARSTKTTAKTTTAKTV